MRYIVMCGLGLGLMGQCTTAQAQSFPTPGGVYVPSYYPAPPNTYYNNNYLYGAPTEFFTTGGYATQGFVSPAFVRPNFYSPGVYHAGYNYQTNYNYGRYPQYRRNGYYYYR
jgi:hypothetical protein